MSVTHRSESVSTGSVGSEELMANLISSSREWRYPGSYVIVLIWHGEIVEQSES